MITLFVALLSEEFDQKLLDIEDVNKENPTLAIDAKVGFLCLRTKQGWEYMICDDCQIAFKRKFPEAKTTESGEQSV